MIQAMRRAKISHALGQAVAALGRASVLQQTAQLTVASSIYHLFMSCIAVFAGMCV